MRFKGPNYPSPRPCPNQSHFRHQRIIPLSRGPPPSLLGRNTLKRRRSPKMCLRRLKNIKNKKQRKRKESAVEYSD